MITDLKPYPAMKDSGVEWLGELPEHWEVRRGKYVFRCIDERSKTGEEELLTVSAANGVIPRRSTSVTMFKAESYVGHKLCWPDDLVINSLWAWGRGLGFADHHGIVSTAYGVYRLRSLKEASPRYLHRLVRSTPYHWELRVRSKGVWISRLQLTDDSFLGSELPLPPLPEQAAIVQYLDHVDRRVRRLTRAKRKLIALLTEQKQAIIHRAVTRGLDPDVPLKDSGVEWLGEVPEHWEVRRLRSLARVKTGERDTKDRVDGGDFPFFVRSQTVERINSWSFDGEAVLTAGDGAGVAKVFHYMIGKFEYHQRVYKFSHFKQVLGKFFFEYFRATLKFEALAGNAKSTVDSLRQPMLLSFPCVLPPTAEQAVIVKHLDQATADIDTAITRAEREIELLNEYRTRLIADVVTGKLDVREAATALPKIDPLADDESDSIDADTEAELADPDATLEEVEA